jgi:hypothetical protein
MVEHVSIVEAQLHNPKGFSTASNKTVLYKNAAGALTWVNPQTISPSAVHGFAYVEDNSNVTNISAANVFVEANVTWTSGDFEDITLVGNEIVINTAGDYAIDVHFSVQGQGGGTKNYQLAVGVDDGSGYPTIVGVDTTRGNLKRDVTSTTVGSWGYTGMLAGLSVGDTLQLLCMNKTDTNNLIVTDAGIRVILNKAT